MVAAVAAGMMVLGSAGSASANIAWCLEDPPLLVQTPSGANLTVNVAVSVLQGEAKYIKTVLTDAVTAPDASGGTLVTVNVTVPATITVARVNAGVRKYKVSTDTVTVAGGTSTTLYLVVPTT